MHMTDLAWKKLHWRVRGIIVREAVKHTKRDNVVLACERVIALCDAGSRDGVVDEVERASASAASASAYAAASADAASAAAAADAAKVMACDRMIDAILTALEEASGASA
jgi:hypothetical protein